MEFEELYLKYYEVIYRFSFRLTGISERAEDITQETFLKLYIYLNSEKTIKNPKAWLYKVASNLSINQIKRAKQHQAIISERLKYNSPNFNVEQDYEKKERIILIRKAMHKIPVRDRILLNLHYDGVTYKDIAEIINVNKTSVSKILLRTISKVSKILKSEKLV